MLLTAKQLAQALDVHITTIRRAYRTKRIPYERLSKLYFFDLDQVRSVMRQEGLDLSVSGAERENRAPGGASRRRALPDSPRIVNRGRNFQGAPRRKS